MIANRSLGRSHRPRLGGRAVVDERQGSHGRAHTLRWELDDFEVPVPLCHPTRDPVARAHRLARLRDGAVDSNVTRRAGSGCGRTSSENAHRPKPNVDAYTGGHAPIVACDKKVEALVHLAGAVNTRASRSVQGPPASALSAVPSQSMFLCPVGPRSGGADLLRDSYNSAEAAMQALPPPDLSPEGF